MPAGETIIFADVGATTTAFGLVGGVYGVDVVGAFTSGSVILEKRAADGVTFVPCQNNQGVATGFNASGYQVFQLPPGTYEFSVASTTGVYINLQRIPYK